MKNLLRVFIFALGRFSMLTVCNSISAHVTHAEITHFFPIHFCVKLASGRGEFDSFFRSNGLQQNVFAVSNPNKCFLRFVTKDAFALTSLRMYALYSTEQSECMHYILLNRASIHHSLQLVWFAIVLHARKSTFVLHGNKVFFASCIIAAIF